MKPMIRVLAAAATWLLPSCHATPGACEGVTCAGDRPSRAAGSAGGFTVPAFTHSPDRRLGVRVPVAGDGVNVREEFRRNLVVELDSGRVLSVIDAPPGYHKAVNYREIVGPVWSADSTVLLWTVSEKWCPAALVLVKVGDGREEWQVDLMELASREILSRTRKASPKRYEAARRANAGTGPALPDGFTVGVACRPAILAFPLPVRVDLTSNPKRVEGFPVNLESHLDGVVTADGGFHARAFRLGARDE